MKQENVALHPDILSGSLVLADLMLCGLIQTKLN
jgi:hypothetical protein